MTAMPSAQWRRGAGPYGDGWQRFLAVMAYGDDWKRAAQRRDASNAFA
jgi:hypothetical protein